MVGFLFKNFFPPDHVRILDGRFARWKSENVYVDCIFEGVQ